ncbi:MAG TPA: metallophosphoesterase [Actinomycetota bacterium]|nr:metallophosphoesterase [Actinomycetota bacterium]
MKIFYATDVHGSEVCWRKFLNAGPFYGADVLILGGDMTGKAMIPIVARDGTYQVTLQEIPYTLGTEEELREMKRRIANRGYYPVVVSPEEMAALAADDGLVQRRFEQEILATVERWMAIAEEKLAGTDLRCFVCPGNDDIFKVDEIIARSSVVEQGEARVIDLDGLSLVSMGWTNPTPWRTYREAPEPKLRERIERMVERVPDVKRAIFNFHAPPYGSNLDEAPALDDDMKYLHGGRAMRPVGSRAVRESILEHQPLLSLHGHIHESKGTVRLGETLAVNPGSQYEDGVLQGALLEVDPKKLRIKNYLLVNG